MTDFGDALAEKTFGGDHLSVDDILNQDIVVVGFEFGESLAYGEHVVIRIESDEEDDSILTWSGVLMDQLEQVRELLPLAGKIERRKDYYTFV